MIDELTLLYVEDDIVVRENFIQIFELYFSKVLTADNGRDALRLYDENHIDVAILDISIPEINGLNVASKIREKDEEIIILIITAYSDKEKLLKAINLGLFGYLVKPVTHAVIDKSLQKIIKGLSKKSLLSISKECYWNNRKKQLLYKNQNIKLTKNEVNIIQLLIDNKNHFLDATTIQDEIFMQKDLLVNNSNNVVQIISRLKKKMFKIYNTDDFFIENCYGVGYKINVLHPLL